MGDANEQQYGPRRLVLSCSVHGPLHEATVYCRHESEDTIRSVQRAHGAPYGGACTEGLLHVELLEVADAD